MQGLVQAGGVVAAVLHARFALFEVLHLLNGGRPTEAVLLGCLLLGVALGCAPILVLQYSQAQLGCRALVLTAALGMLLVMLRPPLPTKVRLLRCPFCSFACKANCYSSAHGCCGTKIGLRWVACARGCAAGLCAWQPGTQGLALSTCAA